MIGNGVGTSRVTKTIEDRCMQQSAAIARFNAARNF
jgi:hypothetical protein